MGVSGASAIPALDKYKHWQQDNISLSERAAQPKTEPCPYPILFCSYLMPAARMVAAKLPICFTSQPRTSAWNVNWEAPAAATSAM